MDKTRIFQQIYTQTHTHTQREREREREKERERKRERERERETLTHTHTHTRNKIVALALRSFLWSNYERFHTSRTRGNFNLKLSSQINNKFTHEATVNTNRTKTRKTYPIFSFMSGQYLKIRSKTCMNLRKFTFSWCKQARHNFSALSGASTSRCNNRLP